MSWSRGQTRASGSVLHSEQLSVVWNWIWERMQDLWPSQHKDEKESTVINETSTLCCCFFVFFNCWKTLVFLWRHCHLCFQLLTSVPVFQSKSGPLTCMHHRMCMMDSSYSPLVWHLLTSWWPAWKPSLYFPLTFSSSGDTQTCAIVCDWQAVDTLTNWAIEAQLPLLWSWFHPASINQGNSKYL